MMRFFTFLALMTLMLPPVSAIAETEAERILKRVQPRQHVYDTLAIVNEALRKSTATETQARNMGVRLELMINVSVKFNFDPLFTCETGKALRDEGQLFIPEPLLGKGQTQSSVIDAACKTVSDYTGEDAFNQGIKILFRTKERSVTDATVQRARPYFDLAEARRFDDPELYMARLMVAERDKDHKAVLRYAEAFLRTNDEKSLPEGIVLHAQAMAGYNLDKDAGDGKAALDLAITRLERAAAAGSKDGAKALAAFKSERDRPQQQASASPGSIPLVSVECDPGLTSKRSLSLTGGPPGVTITKHAGASVTLGYDRPVAGRYSFVCTWGEGRFQKTCGGTITISGQKRRAVIYPSPVSCEYTSFREY